MTTKNDIFANLNEQQLKAAQYKPAPLLVLAGAGSGKTRVLTTRMVHMIQAIMYSSQGNEEKTKEVIRKHVTMKQEYPANPELNLLDEMATRGIRLVSDKLWTTHTGQRTPFGKLGTFWDDQIIPDDAMDIDDLL